MTANQGHLAVARAGMVCVLALGMPARPGAFAQVTTEVEPVTEVPEGYFLFEGDILLPLDYFSQRATYGTSLWPNGHVPFQFDANVNATNQQLMLNAMAAWEAVANVDFVPRNGESNYLHIFDNDVNFSEGVGMEGGHHGISIVSWGSFGVLAHELGHALGYWHEQSRADRDGFVTIDFDNVQQTGCGGQSCNSQFQIRGSGGEYGPYDFDSIMHYDACAFSTCCPVGTACNCPAGCETIVVLPPNDVDWQNNIGQRDHLSDFDNLPCRFSTPRSAGTSWIRAPAAPTRARFKTPISL